MTKIWTQDDINTNTLQTHLTENGVTIERASDNSLGVRSEHGLYIYIRIDDLRTYIRFVCFLDLDTSRSHVDRLQLAQRYNNELFLANFTLGADDDLIVDYPMCFELGLISGQFMRVFRRFSSLVDTLIADHNEDDFIVLCTRPESNESTGTEIVFDDDANVDEPKRLH